MTQLKTSRVITAYPDYTRSDPSLVVVDLITKREFVVADLRLFDLLSQIRSWTSEEDVLNTIKDVLNVSRGPATDVLSTLRENALVIERGSFESSVEQKLREWEEHGWGGIFDYLAYTKDYPFVDYSTAEAWDRDATRMATYVEEDPVPPIYKHCESTETVALPDVTDGKLSSVAAADVFTATSPERFDTGGMFTRRDLSEILYLTFGEIGRKEFQFQGEFLRKTSPSGGARHPTEAYVAVFDVAEVPSGLYHYSVAEHELHKLDNADIARSDITTSAPSVASNESEMMFAVLFTSVLERSQWRYRESRTFRAVLNDVGHLMQTLSLTAFAHGLQVRFDDGFHDEALESLLDVDGLVEPVIRLAGVGSVA